MGLAAKLVVFSSLASLLVGCAGFDTRGTNRAPITSIAPPSVPGGGYYKDDGPGDSPPADLAAIPDAVPRVEPIHRGTSRPYTALGRGYTPMADGRGYRANGLASWYGRRFHGKATSSGEPYDMYAMTAAHPTLPIPSYVRVSNPANGRAVVVRVNDRGPFHPDRIIDLSYTAAWKLDLLRGVAPVEVEYIDPLAPGAALVAKAPAAGDLSNGAGPRPTEVVNAVPLALPAAPAPANEGRVLLATLSDVGGTPLPPIAPSVPHPPPGTGPASTGTPPTASPSGPVAASAGTTQSAYLQIGAFSSGETADRLIRHVRERLGDSLPGVHRLESDGLVKVQVGPYASHAIAELAAMALELETGVKPHRVLR